MKRSYSEDAKCEMRQQSKVAYDEPLSDNHIATLTSSAENLGRRCISHGEMAQDCVLWL